MKINLLLSRGIIPLMIFLISGMFTSAWAQQGAAIGIPCGGDIQNEPLQMPETTICDASSLDDATEKYKETVPEVAASAFTCTNPEACTGSICKLHVFSIISTPVGVKIDDGKYKFREAEIRVTIECICEGDEYGPFPPPSKELECGDPSIIEVIPMGKQTMCTTNGIEALEEYKERVKREVKKKYTCINPDNCENEVCNLTIKFIGNVGGVQYQRGKTFVRKKNVKVRLECECSDTGSSLIDQLPTASFRGADYLLHPYPNPAQQHLFLPLQFSEDQGHVRIAIYNIEGQQVLDLELGEMSKGQHQIKVSTSDIPDGLYYTTLYLNGFDITTQPIVIQH